MSKTSTLKTRDIFALGVTQNRKASLDECSKVAHELLVRIYQEICSAVSGSAEMMLLAM